MNLKRLLRLFYFVAFLCAGFGAELSAQTMPVGLLDNTDELLRRQQLLGKDSSNASYMVRPIFLSDRNDFRFSDDPSEKSLRDWNRLLWTGMDGKAELRALPVVWQNQFNSHHPYGWNDGAMISAKGFQTMFSAGVYAKVGPLTIQLRPEVVYAENSYFLETADAQNEAAVKNQIRAYYNNVDAPERFGDGAYQKAFLGQSSIRLNFDPVSVGLSNENLWWGPGSRNSLLMSNSSPGFLHVTLNTTRPVNTPIGSFETQIVGGKLDGSGIVPPSGQAKSGSWRYLSGIVFVYQPKWVKGLYLGFDRSFTTYKKDMGSSFGDYFPLFSALPKKSSYNPDTYETGEDGYVRDQAFSLFARWVMPESNSEIYFQFGRADHAWDLRDAFVDLEHSRAYVGGFKKMVLLNRSNEFIQTDIEFAQLGQAKSSALRGMGNWYSHSKVKHGYTHEGQYLGAGIGPDNIQSLKVAWVKSLKRIGMVAERRVHNPDLYYRAFNGKTEPRRHWVDLGLGGELDWDYKNFVLNARMIYTHSFNYQYRVENQSPNLFWESDKQDADNLHLRVGVMYRW